jgi:hypothetical protein
MLHTSPGREEKLDGEEIFESVRCKRCNPSDENGFAQQFA